MHLFISQTFCPFFRHEYQRTAVDILCHLLRFVILYFWTYAWKTKASFAFTGLKPRCQVDPGLNCRAESSRTLCRSCVIVSAARSSALPSSGSSSNFVRFAQGVTVKATETLKLALKRGTAHMLNCQTCDGWCKMLIRVKGSSRASLVVKQQRPSSTSQNPFLTSSILAFWGIIPLLLIHSLASLSRSWMKIHNLFL